MAKTIVKKCRGTQNIELRNAKHSFQFTGENELSCIFLFMVQKRL